MYDIHCLIMLKAENPAAYKKLAEEGTMLAHTVSINGNSMRQDIDMPYHATVKVFDTQKDHQTGIHDIARNLKFTPPNPHETGIEPAMFKDRFGNDVYVVKFHGEHANQMKENNSKFSHMGFPTSYEFTPHVSVDKHTWDGIVDSGAKTAAEAGIEFGHAQLKQGHNTVASYKHGTVSHLPKKEDKLAASEKETLVPMHKASQLGKSNYGPAGADLYSDVDNSRRKMDRTSDTVEGAGPNKAVHMTSPSFKQQAHKEAKEARKKSKANPVKVFNRKELRAYGRKKKLKVSPMVKAEEPLKPKAETWYHGSPHLFEHANAVPGGGALGRGHYLTSDKETAGDYSNPRTLAAQGSMTPGSTGYIYHHNIDIKPHEFWEGDASVSSVALKHGFDHAQAKADVKSMGQKYPEDNFNLWLQKIGYKGRKQGNQIAVFDKKHITRIGSEKGTWENINKSEETLEKSLKSLATAATMAATLGLAVPTPVANPSTQHSQVQQSNSGYDSKKMLRTIASVESSGGKFMHHRQIAGGMHDGESAYGKYGLTPVIIKETIRMNKDLKSKYGKVASLEGNDLKHYMQDNPGLEDNVAEKHLSRLEHHFGKDPAKLGYAWLEGIKGTYKAGKENKDIQSHWHVQKIKNAYKEQK